MYPSVTSEEVSLLAELDYTGENLLKVALDPTSSNVLGQKAPLLICRHGVVFLQGKGCSSAPEGWLEALAFALTLPCTLALAAVLGTAVDLLFAMVAAK
eukprot:s416_g15.t1